jgi:hypothetical protein
MQFRPSRRSAPRENRRSSPARGLTYWSRTLEWESLENVRDYITEAFLRACFILSSLYCFLAFIPFTYLFVIIPPYQWLALFVHYNLLIVAMAVGASLLVLL